MLETDRLDAWYGDSHILHGVGLTVASGGRVALVGRNGAGKSTLLKAVMNAGPRATGSVRWHGRALGRLPAFRRARLGLQLVPEDRRIYPHLTVLENIAMARHAAAPGRPALAAEAIVGRFALLQPLARRLGSQLSGGEQQMLAVARALAARPELLLLDEPTEGLAPVIVEQLARDLSAFCAEEGTGLLLCEQNLRFARHTTERLYVIDTGRIVFDGDWAAFDRHDDVKRRHLAV